MKTSLFLTVALFLISSSSFATCNEAAKARALAAGDLRAADDFTPDDGPAYDILNISTQVLGPNEFGISIDFGPKGTPAE